MIVTQLQATRHAGRDDSEAPTHALAYRLQRLETIGRTRGLNADDFRAVDPDLPLSRPEGRIEITTKIDKGEKQFRLTWTEKGGPPVQTPTRRSFGMQLIEKSLVSQQLSGDARVSFNAKGVVCELDIPLVAIQMKISN